MRPALLVLALLAAGCVAPDAVLPRSPAEVAPGVAFLAGDDAPATLAAPPRWQTGEWWRIRVSDDFTGETTEVVKVVVGEREGRWVVGMPADDFQGGLLVLHLPGFTEVWPDNLSFEVHDAPFEPLRFPLEDGATWETGWHQLLTPRSGLTASVTVLSPTQAEVALQGEGGNIRLVYDAELRGIATLDFEGYGAFEVVEHGFGWTGPVRAAVGQDVVVLSQRVAVLDPLTRRPGAPVESFEVAEGYDRVTVGLGAGTLLEPRTPGVYRVKATAPDGTAYELTSTDDRFHIVAHDHADPAGTWTAEHAAAGAGATLLEMIAYTSVEAELGGAGPVASRTR